MRFREDTPALQERARAEVAAWRETNPRGTADAMVEALCASWDGKAGTGFPGAYAPVLRGLWYAIEDARRGEGCCRAALGMEAGR